LRRAYWALCLHWATRGIGWNYQVSIAHKLVNIYKGKLVLLLQIPHIPPCSNASRRRYVLSQSIKTLQYFLCIDTAQSYMHLNPLFSSSLSIQGPLPLTAQGRVFCCVNIIAWIGRAYCMVQLQYTLLSILCVAIGFYDVQDFPPLYQVGSWRDAYTLRRFWGSVFLVSRCLCAHS
jgi:hypothetical protein